MATKKHTPIASALLYLFSFIFVTLLVEIINYIWHHRLCDYGIYPRQIEGLLGIATAPFLHYGWEHLMANTVTLILLGGTVVIFYSRQFLKISILVILMGGLGVWLIGRDAYHVGSSGLLFGYFGFLVSRGLYERTFPAIALSVMVMLLYGGMIYSILPISPYVSWEAHLCGFLSGLIAARIIKK